MRSQLCQRFAFNLVLAVGLAAASPAAAQLKFDWTGGVGFVAKSDIQSAFGWNPKQFETRVGALAFDYVEQYPGLVPVISPGGDLDYLPAWVTAIRPIYTELAYGSETKFGISGVNLLGYTTKFPRYVFEDLVLPEGWEIAGDPLSPKFVHRSILMTWKQTTVVMATLE